MLHRLKIENFKLLRDVVLDLSDAAPTILIGPNASGKSTIIEVLDFLARAAGQGLDAALTAHGGMAAIRTAGSSAPIKISTDWSFDSIEPPRTWKLRWTLCIDARPGGQFYIVSESLRDGDTALISTSRNGVRTVVDELAPADEPSQISNPRVLAFEAFVDPKRYSGLAALRAIVGMVRVLGAVAATPAWARASLDRVSPRDALVISTQSFVGKEGTGLATALYNLQTDHIDAWHGLERAFRAEFPSIKRIVFPPDPAGSRISFALEDERFPGHRVFASEMSDGMIVYLCLLSLILHPEQRAVLALDEPDAHLHPSATRRLMALAHEQADRALIIITHSNAVLDELQDPAASIRIVESTREGARIQKLDAAALDTWRDDYTLSDLRRTGLLDPTNTSYGADK